MRSRWSRSTGPRRSRPRRRAGTDVYLLPAVVGGGLGDIEEVLAAGRRLARAGFRIHLYRRPGRALPPSVAGPWDWPPLRRLRTIRPIADRALTVAPAFGVSAAPERLGALGRPGPWAGEVADLEATYGPDAVVHASLEEFARTLTVRAEERERWREGGVPTRAIPLRLRGAAAERDRATFDTAFRRFRAFDRPNVLALFSGFAPSPAFEREFPDAVGVGPLWPGRYRRTRRTRRPSRTWVWYASPSSAETLAPQVAAGLRDAGLGIRLWVRTPRRWSTALPGGSVRSSPTAETPSEWSRRFATADLRIVTGSRSLLEALELGGPFLYFNGVLGSGPRRRRHRPEKLDALLERARAAGWSAELRRDLSDFARGRRVREVVRRAARREGPWRRFPDALPLGAYPEERSDLGGFLVRIARELGRPGSSASALVARVRSGAPVGP